MSAPKSEVGSQETGVGGRKAPASEKPAKTAGQLAVASPRVRNGGWVYLAAAVALLLAAGAIIARLLRPRPQPSAISQSLDGTPR